MILHRFCSAIEFEAFQRVDLLVNNTDHSVKRGSASTSVGFCFLQYSCNPNTPNSSKLKNISI